MHLQSLLISGFKTFAAPTTIEFAPGITAIVGANGSGKSNLVDALRWALGEQSLRELRTQRAEELIFAGSASRRAASMAEVRLILADDGSSAARGTEIELTRRIYRSGDGEYLLNRDRFRLRDVPELFHDCGLLATGHAVIGQGMVDAVLSVRGSERRALIAAVAGVASYEAQKAEALQRLELTRRNIADAEMVLGELEPRLKLVRRQAHVVQSVACARQALEEGLRRYYAAQRDRLLVERTAAQSHLAAVAAKIVELRAQIGAVERAIHDQHVQWDAIRRERDEARLAVIAAELEFSHMEEMYRAAKAACSEDNRQIAELQERLVMLERQQADSDEQVRQQESALIALLDQQQSCARKVQEQEAIVAERRESANLLVLARGHAKRVVDEAEQAVAVQRAAAEQLRGALQRIQGAIQAGEEELVRLGREVQQASEAVEAARKQRARAEHTLERAQQIRDERTVANSALHMELVAAQTEYGAHERERTLLRQQYEALQRRYRARDTSNRDPTASGNSESVIEGLRFGEEFSAAVAAALGDLTEAPLYAPAKLPGPRCAPVPTATWQEAVLACLQLGGVRVRGWLSDFVALTARHTVLRPYLAATLVLEDGEDLEYAWALVAPLSALSIGYPALRLVDLAGHLRGAGFCLAASHRAREATAHVVTLNVLEKRLAELERICASTAERVAEAERQAGEAATLLAQAESEYSQARRSATSAAADLESAERHERTLHVEMRRIADQLARLRDERERRESELVVATDAIHALEEKVARCTEELEVAVSRAEVACQQLSESEQQAQMLRSDYVLLQRRIELEQNEYARLQAQREHMEKEKNQLTTRLQEVERRREQNQEALVRAGQKLLASKSALQEAQHRLEHFELCQPAKQLEPVQKVRLDALRAELEAALGDQEHGRAQIERLEEEWQLLQRNCQADLGCDPATLSSVSADAESDIPTDLELRRLRIKAEQADEIDPGVVEEYRSLQERCDRLNAHLADLRAATANLEHIIERADHELHQRFSTSFARVNDLFASYVRTMFAGGSAELLLSDDASSVEIVVQPPGKRARALNLLSGGERALAASAFLFALVAAHPPPFCVFDEVDAALDETNVDRYAGVLRELSSRTQFVIVTHNRGTMAAADSLYGVVLDADATSRVLSVRLSELAS
jgi:chromosome segregation protein